MWNKWNATRGPSNKKELMEKLYEKSIGGDWKALALAYLVNELIPEDRTSKRVFSSYLKKVNKND